MGKGEFWPQLRSLFLSYLKFLTQMVVLNMMQIWTDGACEPNPGKGGWGYTAIDDDGIVSEKCGGDSGTTNNRMEMIAILMALQALPDGASAVIYSDSQYCVKGLTIWSAGWAKRNWMLKPSQGDGPMPNRDLWLALEKEKKRVRASFEWVRGHAGNHGNERADELASIGRLRAMNGVAA